MISQMSESSSLSISITAVSSAHNVRFRKAKAISRTHSPSIIGRERRVSHSHRCSINSGTHAWDGSVKSSFKSSYTVSVRPCSCSTFSVLPVSPTLAKIGALVCGGGRFKRDGAPNCVPSLHRRAACFRLIFCRALCSAMERVLRFTGLFPVYVS